MEEGTDRRPIILAAFALLAVAIVAVILISRAGGDDSEEPAEDGGPVAAESAEEAGERSKPEVTVPDGDPPQKLVEEELVEGTGAEAKSGDEVTVQYVGVGYDSEEEFDASWGGEPFTFTLGESQVIPGWEQGVEGMKEGGRRELVIPPELAYGEAGQPPSIGPDEPLVFVVDLLSVN